MDGAAFGAFGDDRPAAAGVVLLDGPGSASALARGRFLRSRVALLVRNGDGLAALLSGYLASAARLPFGYGSGRLDCCLFVAGWMTERCGGAVARDLAGYQTEFEAEKIADLCGGFEAACAAAAKSAGWVRTATPRLGDVVVARRVGVAAAGIVARDGLVAMKTRRGVVVSRAEIAAAWSPALPTDEMASAVAA